MSAPCGRFEREHLADLLAQGALDPDARAHLDGCAECDQQRAAYERIAGAMRGVDADHAPRPDRLVRLWARLDAEGAPPADRARARRRWIAGACAGLAAAAALLWWLGGGEAPPLPPPRRLAIEILPRRTAELRGDAALGDHLRVRARAGAAVWIYRNERQLLLVCPRDCARRGDELIGEIALDAIARYEIVWVSAERAPPPGGDLERDVAAAAAAGATHEIEEIVIE